VSLLAFSPNIHSWHEFAQQVVNWLALGSIYALLGIGIAAVFAVVGLVNFAHGEILLVAGIAMLVLGEHGVPWQAMIPLAILAGGAAAVLMELVAFRPVRNAPALTLLLTSLGVSLIVRNVVRLWRGPRSEAIDIPDLTAASFQIGSVRIAWIDVATILSTLAALVLLNLFLRKSILGLAMRASSEDLTMTRLMGIRANAVITTAFAVSGLLAGLAAFFYFGATTGQVQWDFGFNLLVKGLVAAVIGGLTSLSGAVLGGFVLAFLEVFFQIMLPPENTPFSVAIVFGVVVLVLFFRPQGLLAGRGVGAERV
jgi:branched-chain amino acid transport system permease protein